MGCRLPILLEMESSTQMHNAADHHQRSSHQAPVPRALPPMGNYPPANEYMNHADKSRVDLVEAFKNMQVGEDQPFENGDVPHEDEVLEEEVEQNGGDESLEEAEVADADSNDGAVLVNGNEAEEEWGTNEEESPSA